MDLRIVNTCNNNCLYCLEQELRTQQEYISTERFQNDILNKNDKNLTFYGGNPLLHPDLKKIITIAKENGFYNIGLLSNTDSLSRDYLEELIDAGLNNIGFYFYGFQERIHKLYSGGDLSVSNLCRNIKLISESNIYIKCIIHVHKGNIKTLERDIEILHKKFHVMTFEFIDYMLVDRAKKYEKLLAYNIEDYSENRDLFFEKIKELNIKVKFVRFSEDFFGDFQEYNT